MMMKKIDLRFWKNPRLRYGGMSTLILCLCLAALVALNGLFTALEERGGWRMDFSFNSMTTYSDVTAEVLEALDTPVHIYALFERGQEDLQMFELLNRYCAGSALVTWEQAPLSLNPQFTTRFQGSASGNEVTANSLIVTCESTGRFRVLTDFVGISVDVESGSYNITSVNYEREITAAISYVTQETIPVVYMLQGHGEVSADAAAYLNELLLDSHYEVRYATLNQIELKPEDTVIFLAPQSKDLTSAELTELASFIDAGGSILFAASAYDPLTGSDELPLGMPNYRELMQLYGFIPLEGMVLASSNEPGSYDGAYRFNLYAALEPGEITLELMLGNVTRLYMSQARAFQTPEGFSGNAQTSPILYSGQQAYLHDVYGNSRSLAQQPDDPTGPFALGLEAFRFSDTGDVSRAVALGSTDMLISETSHSSAFSRAFILEVMDFLSGSDSTDVSIAPKEAFRPRLSADALSMGSVMLVMLPLAILAAALVILYPRRHL